MPSNVVPTEPRALKKDPAKVGSKQKTPAPAAPAPPLQPSLTKAQATYRQSVVSDPSASN